MNILVINIALRPASPVKLFPIGLGYITTAMKRAGYDFDLLDIDACRYADDEVEARVRKKKYDVICLGCIVTGYKKIKSLSHLIKEYHPHAKIIAGNSVATSITDTLLTRTKVDIALIGEGDETIVDLLQAIAEKRPLETVKGICFLKNGIIIRTQDRPLIKDISVLPFVDYSLFDVETYIEHTRPYVSDPLPIPREEVRALPVNTARGCIYNCGFCYHVFRGEKYRFRSADVVIAEVKSLIEKYSVNYILFHDELTFFNKKQALEFAQRILNENISFYWAADCRGNLFQKEEDVEIIEQLRKAGCLGLAYSLESAEPEILHAMNKRITVEQFSKQTQICKKGGLTVWTSLVFGYPQETSETIKKTIDVCIQNEIYPSAGYLLPQPGSPMYDYVVQNGVIQDEEEYLMQMGDRQDLRINLTSMTDEELENNVREGLNRCSKVLELGLKDEELVKSLFYRAKKQH